MARAFNYRACFAQLGFLQLKFSLHDDAELFKIYDNEEDLLFHISLYDIQCFISYRKYISKKQA